ncbi:hypothetical protein CUMW_268180 [Citrus unshiu]|uniref:Uncharacterized protein n=1 Tax=Citrus unshiu TaxID=55188 RepID=A0A2H5QWF1_CITUN|nr:hypothetical protein CUMW_268180 [Citrus unshiu]
MENVTVPPRPNYSYYFRPWFGAAVKWHCAGQMANYTCSTKTRNHPRVCAGLVWLYCSF